MSDSIQPAAPPTPTTPADRLKACVKLLASFKPSQEVRADVQFIISELLDLMPVHVVTPPAPPDPLPNVEKA